jgi:hypothetical protein
MRRYCLGFSVLLTANCLCCGRRRCLMRNVSSPKVPKRQTFRLRGGLQTLGPGLITGASDDDPSGIGTYSQAGAQLGFGIGWTMLLTYPLMVAIQEISARIGRVTGHGIAGNVCRHFAGPFLWPLLFLLFVANTVNIAADLAAMGDRRQAGWRHRHCRPHQGNDASGPR